MEVVEEALAMRLVAEPPVQEQQELPSREVQEVAVPMVARVKMQWKTEVREAMGLDKQEFLLPAVQETPVVRSKHTLGAMVQEGRSS